MCSDYKAINLEVNNKNINKINLYLEILKNCQITHVRKKPKLNLKELEVCDNKTHLKMCRTV